MQNNNHIHAKEQTVKTLEIRFITYMYSVIWPITYMMQSTHSRSHGETNKLGLLFVPCWLTTCFVMFCRLLSIKNSIFILFPVHYKLINTSKSGNTVDEKAISFFKPGDLDVIVLYVIKVIINFGRFVANFCYQIIEVL